MNHTLHLHDRAHANESLAFRTIFVLVFVILYVACVLALLLGVQWRELLPGAENSKGFVEGVSSAVYTLMSYIT